MNISSKVWNWVWTPTALRNESLALRRPELSPLVAFLVCASLIPAIFPRSASWCVFSFWRCESLVNLYVEHVENSSLQRMAKYMSGTKHHCIHSYSLGLEAVNIRWLVVEERYANLIEIRWIVVYRCGHLSLKSLLFHVCVLPLSIKLRDFFIHWKVIRTRSLQRDSRIADFLTPTIEFRYSSPKTTRWKSKSWGKLDCFTFKKALCRLPLPMKNSGTSLRARNLESLCPNHAYRALYLLWVTRIRRFASFWPVCWTNLALWDRGIYWPRYIWCTFSLTWDFVRKLFLVEKPITKGYTTSVAIIIVWESVTAPSAIC